METISRLANFRPDEPPPWRLLLHKLDARTINFLVGGRRPPTINGPRLLNLGCGPLIYSGWINADYIGAIRMLRSPQNKPNWLLDATKPWNCPDAYFDGIFCQHVLEHLFYPDVIAVLGECRRTIKPGAWIRISVPDIHRFIDYESQGFSTLPEAVSSVTQHYRHVSVWSTSLMASVLQEVGFSEVNIVAFGSGSDPRLLVDQEGKRSESLYVEARA